MKAKKLLLLCALLAPLVSLDISADYDVEIGGIYYLLDSEAKTATVSYEASDHRYKYVFYTGSVTIPETIQLGDDFYTVTGIGSWAFSDCMELTSVSIPETVTWIEDYAFDGTKNLEHLTIPNSVTSMGECVFCGSGIKSVILSENCDFFGFEAFYACKNLTSITIPNSVIQIPENAFIGCI